MLICETQRLIIRQFTLLDAPFIIELLNTPTWIQFLGNRNINTEDDARNYLTQGPLTSYEVNGYGPYLVALKETNTPIGLNGLIKRDGLSHADIGFAFLPAYTGQGYAFESAKAVMDYGYNTLHLPHIVAVARHDNNQSITLLGKLGLKFYDTIFLPGIAHELMYFK